MATDSDELKQIKRLCILNFLELQEIKRRLNIQTTGTQEFYDYQNAVPGYMNELDDKMRGLVKDYPHLSDSK